MSAVSMAGKVCVVTGATGGIGLEAARALHAMGARIVLVGRSEERGARAVADIAGGSDPDRLRFVRADLSQLEDVRAAAARIAGHHERIDVLINNAGVVNTRRRVTVDGFEETFAVNHLAHFVLTGLLLDRLRAVPQGRVVNVSSDAHVPFTLDFDDFNAEKSYSTFKAYGRSKLANLLFTLELADRLEGTPVTVNALHPGFVASGFGKNNGWLANLVYFLARPVSISPRRGALTAVHLASAPELSGVSGRYFYKNRIKEPAPAACDPVAARALWAASEAMAGHPFGLTESAAAAAR